MSSKPQPSNEERSDEEQDLLDIAETDLDSARFAENILRAKYGYEEDELP